MIKNIHVFSVGHDSSTCTQSRSSTRHRRDARVGEKTAQSSIHPSGRATTRPRRACARARRDVARTATRRDVPDGGSEARGGARRHRRSGPSGRVAATAVARARDRAVARASLEEWRPFPIPHARRLATAIVPYLRRLATAIPHLRLLPTPMAYLTDSIPTHERLETGSLFIDFSFVTVCTGCPNARRRYFNATRSGGAPTLIRRVSGRGTDRDAACGDVIMNDDQAKKIKTDDDGASLIFFIYD